LACAWRSILSFYFELFSLSAQVRGDSAIASFDPYQILSIDRGATDKQIKKAYKLKVSKHGASRDWERRWLVHEGSCDKEQFLVVVAILSLTHTSTFVAPHPCLFLVKALELHPDKNIGDKHAANMFMMVAKAYGERPSRVSPVFFSFFFF
jgi:hypothetical protein